MKHFFKKYYFSIIPFLILGFLLTSCSSTPQKPSKDSKKYRQTVSDFYVSLAAIQSDQALFAIKKMQQVADAYPAEAAAWANLSVYTMRQGNFEAATKRMKKAVNRAGENADIQFLDGILESRKGNIKASLKHLQEAVHLDSTNSKALFKLTEELEREDPGGNVKKIKALLDRISAQDSSNLAVLLEKVRIAAKWGTQSELKHVLQKLEEQSIHWPDEIREQFGDQKSSILEKEGNDVSFELAFLRNNLNQLPRFQYDLRQIQLPPDQIGFLIPHFLWLPNANHIAAPPDTQLTFSSSEASENDKVQLFKAVGLASNKQVNTISIKANTATVSGEQKLDFPGNSKLGRLSPNAVIPFDYDYDFLNDLAFAGSSGFKLYRQQQDSTFTDVTESLNLPSSILQRSFSAGWAKDFDLDGDLDLLLSAKDGDSYILQNSGDGTFKVRSYFGESDGIRDFLWGDFDRDGDPDAVILTGKGEVHYYRNRRGAKFQRDTSFTDPGSVYALAFGDLNSDGVFEILDWRGNRINSTWYSDSTGSWQKKTLVTFKNDEDNTGAFPQLFVADIDNNSAFDLILSDQNTTKYWLSDKNIALTSKVHTVSSYVYNLADVNKDTRLDFIGLTKNNHESIRINKGSKEYKAQIFNPRASGPTGDQRINSFGIGGEIESRSGLEYSKQPIEKPWVHVGLGTYDQADMMRIIWPNGSVQAEFAELGYNSNIQNKQILKGSCPWVFTYDGKKMAFVTDFIWRTALGLKINLQGKSNVIHSIDWIKIDRDQLQPRDGFYDVRITADLWETHFFDHVSLMAVDHPRNTDVLVDERFKLPAPKQKLYPIQKMYPIKSAMDQNGRDVTDKVAYKDGDYVHSFSLTPYQGVAHEHYIEVDVGRQKPKQGSQKLVASGWIYPTDTSINIALNQAKHKPLHGIRVEVPNGKGGWEIVQKDIGFPSGKNKTIIVNLDGIFEPGTDHRVRLCTNMEIYWDHIRIGIQRDDIQLKTHRLEADSVNLHYRGFSKMEKKDRYSPTVPNYQQIVGTTPKWRDLIGFYTRYGDVKELTKKSDDRYVIMNAGDELAFKFHALTPPRKGWTRDFVLIGDGWVKDGDYNTDHSKTVLPLPYHGMKDYSTVPGLLQDDPVYQKHKQDWIKFQTRYITPYNFSTALQLKN